MRAAVETLAEGSAASLEALARPLVEAQGLGSKMLEQRCPRIGEKSWSPTQAAGEPG